LADDTQLNPGKGGDLISTDDIGGGVKVQNVKVAFGVGGTMQQVDGDNPLPIQQIVGTTTVRSSPTNTADAQVLPVNADRLRADFFNDADKDYLLGEGSAPVTLTDFTVRLRPGGMYASNFAGELRGFFVDAPTSGRLMVTEVT